MTVMKFHYRGHRIEIFRDGSTYAIVVDDYIRQEGLLHLPAAKACACSIVDSDMIPICKHGDEFPYPY